MKNKDSKGNAPKKKVDKLMFLLIFLTAASVINFMIFKPDSATAPKELKYSEFTNMLSSNIIKSVKITNGYDITGTYGNSGEPIKKYKLTGIQDAGLADRLLKSNVEVVGEIDRPNMFLQYFLSWLPFILLIGVWIFFMRKQIGGKSGLFNTGKSRAKWQDGEGQITFDDVAGIDEAKSEVMEVVDFLKNPSKYDRLGGKIPSGLLLVGPPGTGKTLMARAIAGEAGVPMSTISGSEFVQMFVGVGAARVRDMFAEAKKRAPCLIFIDEIDAVGQHRSGGMGGATEEREQTLNQLLVEMDGFEKNDHVIVVAATNRVEKLDAALLRPGRFTRHIDVSRPDIKGRRDILEVHIKALASRADKEGGVIDESVDLTVVAKGTPGFTGADLENLVNEASLAAAKNEHPAIRMEDLDEAKDKILMGPSRESMVITKEQKEMTAYHEAGHAIIAKLMPKADPVHKVSIIPRGGALGVTIQLPDEDRWNYDKEHALNTICILMGGRVAEELKFNSVTSGASNDFEKATSMATKMVTEWGMSDLGVAVCKQEMSGYLGAPTSCRQVSQVKESKIDETIEKILSEQYERCKGLLQDNFQILDSMSEVLIDLESIDRDQVDSFFK